MAMLCYAMLCCGDNAIHRFWLAEPRSEQISLEPFGAEASPGPFNPPSFLTAVYRKYPPMEPFGLLLWPRGSSILGHSLPTYVQRQTPRNISKCGPQLQVPSVEGMGISPRTSKCGPYVNTALYLNQPGDCAVPLD